MGAAFSLFTLNACTEMVLFNDQVETEDSKLSDIPLDFTWSMSQDVNIELKSDVYLFMKMKTSANSCVLKFLRLMSLKLYR